MPTRIAILGATGFTALELIRILLRHPSAEIVALTSRQERAQPIDEIHPSLAGRIALKVENLSPAEVVHRAHAVFSCLPHGASAEIVRQLLDAGVRVIDFSADYRLRDPDQYRSWYGAEHADPDRLKEAVYGLPELYADRIRAARLVANPGCYPTGAILALAPLLRAGSIRGEDIIIDAKSGVSGAGRTPSSATHFVECNESIAAYKVGAHRHTPEIDQTLSETAGAPIRVIFTPHLVPMDRGILSTCYAHPTRRLADADVLQVLREAYASCPFVRVVDHLPATKFTTGTNFCDISARVVGDRIIVLSAIDNLVKGAAGAAVQNFNLMFGFPETTAL